MQKSKQYTFIKKKRNNVAFQNETNQYTINSSPKIEFFRIEFFQWNEQKKSIYFFVIFKPQAKKKKKTKIDY